LLSGLIDHRSAPFKRETTGELSRTQNLYFVLKRAESIF
jgi:hypothetical protein